MFAYRRPANTRQRDGFALRSPVVPFPADILMSQLIDQVRGIAGGIVLKSYVYDILLSTEPRKMA